MKSTTITITIKVDSNGVVTVDAKNNGNKAKRTKPSGKKTTSTYLDRWGVNFPVYLSDKGHKFLWRTKNGRKYRQYLNKKQLTYVKEN